MQSSRTHPWPSRPQPRRMETRPFVRPLCPMASSGNPGSSQPLLSLPLPGPCPPLFPGAILGVFFAEVPALESLGDQARLLCRVTGKELTVTKENLASGPANEHTCTTLGEEDPGPLGTSPGLGDCAGSASPSSAGQSNVSGGDLEPHRCPEWNRGHGVCPPRWAVGDS